MGSQSSGLSRASSASARSNRRILSVQGQVETGRLPRTQVQSLEEVQGDADFQQIAFQCWAGDDPRAPHLLVLVETVKSRVLAIGTGGEPQVVVPRRASCPSRRRGKEKLQTVPIPDGRQVPVVHHTVLLSHQGREIKTVLIVGEEDLAAEFLRPLPMGAALDQLGGPVQGEDAGVGPILQVPVHPDRAFGLIDGDDLGMKGNGQKHGKDKGKKGSKDPHEGPQTKKAGNRPPSKIPNYEFPIPNSLPSQG
jgi:hypothetical protein